MNTIKAVQEYNTKLVEILNKAIEQRIKDIDALQVKDDIKHHEYYQGIKEGLKHSKTIIKIIKETEDIYTRK